MSFLNSPKISLISGNFSCYKSGVAVTFKCLTFDSCGRSACDSHSSDVDPITNAYE